MAYSNPFRKKSSSPATTDGRFPPLEDIDTDLAQSTSASAASRPTGPPRTSFRHGSHSEDGHDYDERIPEASAPAPERQKKAKVVKKVRVVSPPPLSPDSPEWPYNSLPQAAPPTVGTTVDLEDPFAAAKQMRLERESLAAAAAPPPSTASHTESSNIHGEAPANPFSKTLEDIENFKKEEELKEELKEERREEGAALKAANNKGQMNVDSFRRLLMTGNTGDGAGAKIPTIDGEDESSKTSTTAGSNHQILPQEAEESDSSTTVNIGQRKKAPPPPPSSRHGKSIRTGTESQHPMKETSHPTDDAFEPASPDAPYTKSPEPESDVISNARKAAPAPPPRRGHGKPQALSSTAAPRTSLDEEQESAPMRSSANRHSMHAPAPPPPRRPHTGPQRASMIQTSPTSGPFAALTGYDDRSVVSTPSYEAPAPLEPQDHHNLKSTAPPPPPTRNTSLRRPPSISSVDLPSSRQVSGESTSKLRENLPPPPPPSRKRGSSKGSLDGPPSRMASTDTVPRSASIHQHQQHPLQISEAADSGQGENILADLDALQREIDMLRGKAD